MAGEIENGMKDMNLGDLSLVSDDTKDSIRSKVWRFMEKNNIAKFPRPVTKRIPNFEGANQACDNLPGLEEFKRAQTVKVNPDKPQEQARFLVMEGGKSLVVTPLRRSARRNVLHQMEPPQDASDKDLRLCSRYQGVKDHSVPVGFESKVRVDLVVVGCVAASKKGWRIGKGEGFADLEYAMMSSMGAVNENTVVVATCHDCQVLDLPDDLFGPHDLTVDYILTPTQVIKCDRKPKPKGIIWSMLTEDKLDRIPILKKLRFMERQAGNDTRLADQTDDIVVGPDDVYVEPEEPEEDDDEDRRRTFRRRFNQQRRRQRRPRPEQNGEAAEGEDEMDSPSRRPKPRRQRRRPRKSEGDSNVEADGEGRTDEEGDGRPPRGQRRQRRRNPRRRRSQGSESRGEDEEGDADKENKSGPPRRQRNQYRRRRGSGGQRRSEGRGDASEDGGAGDDGERPPKERRQRRRREGGNGPLPAVYVGNLPRGLRVSEFKSKFRQQNVNPLRVTWRGQIGYSYLVFESMDQVENAMQVLKGMSINDRELRVELANRTQQRAEGDESTAAAGDAPVDA